jgi:hypothetical protein
VHQNRDAVVEQLKTVGAVISKRLGYVKAMKLAP